MTEKLNSITFRAPRIEDAEEICAITNMPKFRAGTARLPFTRVENTRKWLSSLKDRHIVILALLNDKIVGSCDVRCAEGRRSHAGTIGIGVHDDYQGQGIGTGMMGQIIDVADNWLNLKRLDLLVYADNVPAIQLYEKFGFEREGVLRSDSFRDGHYVDSLMMARLRF
ncbi:GNAT family N-acetyltransferase [Brucella pseudogrignonensis]|jgi:putative acetyltransferase|uniref:Acetyltransferase domain protein n=1 Tax=Brucella pseudogrignonensis TaxID=419475 RepID=A0A1A9FJF0_9HYPH|nr:GNAT family N-acetyltransferase [Brucella pseudogrignonensis]EMG55170.1 N-acetyltransferase GCN5 [Ochrobactrum sp. CDB2]ANG95434.1 GNAT family acetyltransferase [Brucella pseudogrignonensis]MCM0751830.1 GNAT family N-acetyltransferase [Brucella pseudogrignonensis]NNV20850.1 GNAT family N-acetyltransferase [Brucella pseudogrignonensis]OYR27811.1 acetyltransferase domain protein [Brucella pseudogrignonensis]